MVCCRCSRSNPMFFGAFQISAPLRDTCVEVWEVNGDDYLNVIKLFFQNTFTTWKWTSSINEDLTGYLINSSRPISVYGGHACANVPINISFCDHMVEQIPPISELGQEHIVPPIIGRNPTAG